MERTHITNADGTLTVRHESAPLKVTDEKTGTVTEQPQVSQWDIMPHQVEKHLPQFREQMSAGDLSAAQDAANEWRKQAK